jgi:hypothetical protein
MQALIGLPEIESQIIIQEMILLNLTPYPLRTARNRKRDTDLLLQIPGKARSGLFREDLHSQTEYNG